MEEKKRNVPKLRFPGFTDEWEQRKYSDVINLLSGQDFEPSEYNDGGNGIPYMTGASCIVDGETVVNRWTETPKCIAYKGDVLLVCKGSGYGAIAILTQEKAHIARQFMALRCTETLDNTFNYYLAHSVVADIKKDARGLIAGIARDAVLSEEIAIPSFDEQMLIGKFLSNLDNLITLHQRKLDRIKEYKNGLLQKMFPKDGEKVPEIRFPGFTGDWEQRKLGELCERVVRKNKNNESDLPLTISSQYGLIDQRDFFNKVVAAKDMSNYYLLKKGEFAYNKSYSNGFDYGSIKRLNAYDQGCLSTLYICFALKSEDVDSDYLESYFDTLLWYGDVSQICAEGARNHGLLNVDTKAFFDDVSITIPPTKEEQKSISSFINSFDILLELHQRKLELMKEYKKGLLQQMFV